MRIFYGNVKISLLYRTEEYCTEIPYNMPKPEPLYRSLLCVRKRRKTTITKHPLWGGGGGGDDGRRIFRRPPLPIPSYPGMNIPFGHPPHFDVGIFPWLRLFEAVCTNCYGCRDVVKNDTAGHRASRIDAKHIYTICAQRAEGFPLW